MNIPGAIYIRDHRDSQSTKDLGKVFYDSVQDEKGLKRSRKQMDTILFNDISGLVRLL